MIKKYLIFGGWIYYASGGFHDLLGNVDTIEEAKIIVEKKEIGDPDNEWWQIVDITTGEIILKSECDPHGIGAQFKFSNGVVVPAED